MSASVQENRLRRMAKRQGLRLVKARRRDPLALDYGRFSLVDAASGEVVLGGTRDIAQVETQLRDGRREA